MTNGNSGPGIMRRGSGRAWGTYKAGPPSPLTPFKWFFQFIWHNLAWIIFLLVLIGLGVFIFNLFIGGGVGTLTTEAETGLEETGAGRTAVGFFKNIFDIIINPEKAVAEAGTFETSVRENRDNEELGVFLDDLTFNIKNKVFEEGKRIVGRARLKSESLLDTTEVKISCSVEDYDKTKSSLTLSGSGVTANDKITVYKGRPSINSILCEYKEGIQLEDLDKSFFESEERGIAALKFLVKASYDFETDAFSRVYYMNSESLESILLDGEDPFKRFNIKDSLIQRDGTVKSENTAGPISFFIVSSDAQPFTEGNSYFLEIGIRAGGIKWKGDLKQLNSLEIHVPSELIMDGENCDLQISNERYDDDIGFFTIYNLKDEHIERINDVCSKIGDAGILGDTCLDRLEDESNFLCQFSLQDANNIEPEFTYLRGKAEYEFETRIAGTVKIVRKEENLT